MPSKLSQLIELGLTIARLPVAHLEFKLHLNPDDVGKMHRYFTMRHPRYKIIRNKSLGAALVDLTRYRSGEAYLESIKGRNSAEHHARKARAKGYRVVEIDRNDYIDEIHEINTSIEIRQGRPMADSYRDKVMHFPRDKNYIYYGVLNANGKLMAYGDLGRYGNFMAFNRVLGVRNNDGVMHLMLTEIICGLIAEGSCRYLMYDTFFGAGPGLKLFKNMLGFQPYRAKYSIQ
jgi:hypothetical protein